MTSNTRTDPYTLLDSIAPGDALEIVLDYLRNQQSDDALADFIQERWSFDAPPAVSPPSTGKHVYYKAQFLLTVLSRDRPASNRGMDGLTVTGTVGFDFIHDLKPYGNTRLKPCDVFAEIGAIESDEPEAKVDILMGRDHWKYDIRCGDKVVYIAKGSHVITRSGKLRYIDHQLDHVTLSWQTGDYQTVRYDDLYQSEEDALASLPDRLVVTTDGRKPDPLI